MILLHGWGFNKTIWERFSKQLGAHKTTALNLKGNTLDALVNHVLKEAPEKTDYCGWSLGGLVAMKIAIDHPERVNRLITIASTPKFVSKKDWPGMAPETLTRFAQALKTDYHQTLQQFIKLQFQGTSTDRQLIRELKNTINQTPTPNTDELAAGLEILKKTDLRATLKQITAPQLHLYGRCDRLVPVEMTEQLKPLLKHAKTVIIPHAGHALFLSHPDRCEKHITAFLDHG